MPAAHYQPAQQHMSHNAQPSAYQQQQHPLQGYYMLQPGMVAAGAQHPQQLHAQPSPSTQPQPHTQTQPPPQPGHHAHAQHSNAPPSSVYPGNRTPVHGNSYANSPLTQPTGTIAASPSLAPQPSAAAAAAMMAFPYTVDELVKLGGSSSRDCLNDQLTAAKLFCELAANAEAAKCEEVAKKGMLTLARLLKVPHQSIQTHVAQTIALLARQETNHIYIFDHGLLPTLLEVLDPSKDKRLLEAVLAALTHLAKREHACTVIASLGLSRIIPMLRVDSIGVQCNALALLCALAAVPTLVDRLVEHDVLYHLYFLRDRCADADIQQNARWALQLMHYSDNDPSKQHLNMVNELTQMGFSRGRIECALRKLRLQNGKAESDVQKVTGFLLDHEADSVSPTQMSPNHAYRAANHLYRSQNHFTFDNAGQHQNHADEMKSQPALSVSPSPMQLHLAANNLDASFIQPAVKDEDMYDFVGELHRARSVDDSQQRKAQQRADHSHTNPFSKGHLARAHSAIEPRSSPLLEDSSDEEEAEANGQAPRKNVEKEEMLQQVAVSHHQDIDQLVDMGFTKRAATMAFMHNNSFERALSWLLNQQERRDLKQKRKEQAAQQRADSPVQPALHIVTHSPSLPHSHSSNSLNYRVTANVSQSKSVGGSGNSSPHTQLSQNNSSNNSPALSSRYELTTPSRQVSAPPASSSSAQLAPTMTSSASNTALSVASIVDHRPSSAASVSGSPRPSVSSLPASPMPPLEGTPTSETALPIVNYDESALTESELAIKSWLERRGFPELVAMFVSQNVSLDELSELSENDLGKMGIKTIGKQKKILKAIRQDFGVVADEHGQHHQPGSSSVPSNSNTPNMSYRESATPPPGGAEHDHSHAASSPSPRQSPHSHAHLHSHSNSLSHPHHSLVHTHSSSTLQSALQNAALAPHNRSQSYDCLQSAHGHATLPQHRPASQSQSHAHSHLPVHLAFLQANPLIYSEMPGVSRRLDFEKEVNVLHDALNECGRALRVRFGIATKDNMLRMLTKGSRALHISGHGDPMSLVLESGTGGLECLDVSTLREMLVVGGNELQFVFISACFSSRAALAFVAAGVPHVIAVQESTQVMDNSARTFAHHVYMALCTGRTVREAFHKGQASVIASGTSSRPCCCAHLHATECQTCSVCRSPMCCSVHAQRCHTTTPCCQPNIPHGESVSCIPCTCLCVRVLHLDAHTTSTLFDCVCARL